MILGCSNQALISNVDKGVNFKCIDVGDDGNVCIKIIATKHTK